MQFLSLLKFGLRSLVAETKSLKSSFSHLSSKIIANSAEFTIFIHILVIFARKIYNILRIAKNDIFRVFLEIMKNVQKYLVGVTPSISIITY